MRADLLPCPFCNAELKHVESAARSFNPPRMFHEYHHPRNDCMLFDGIICSFDDDPAPRLKWVDAWNRRAADAQEPVAWTSQKALDEIRANPGNNKLLVWGEPLPYHPDVPLFTSPVVPVAAKAEAEGWRLVPIEPTWTMACLAGEAANVRRHVSEYDKQRDIEAEGQRAAIYYGKQRDIAKRLTSIADASKRANDTDIPLGLELRAGAAEIDRQAATISQLQAEIARLRESLEPLTVAAYGLSGGTDWNNGTHAKLHGYRQKLLDAIPAARAALGRSWLG